MGFFLLLRRKSNQIKVVGNRNIPATSGDLDKRSPNTSENMMNMVGPLQRSRVSNIDRH